MLQGNLAQLHIFKIRKDKGSSVVFSQVVLFSNLGSSQSNTISLLPLISHWNSVAGTQRALTIYQYHIVKSEC